MAVTRASDRWDICIVGAGAAGLMTAIWARRTTPAARVIVVDGARRLGAKILIAGGGRCNVTNVSVDERDFNGSSPMAIRKILRRFDAARTVDFFRAIGVPLKREPLGKLFPTDDRARTVLAALVREAERQGAILAFPRRVDHIETGAARFRVCGAWGDLEAQRLVLATGGQSVPKTGSDGTGFRIARQLGHSLTPLLPALVPLCLPAGHFLTELRGIAIPVELELRSGTGKRLRRVAGALLCTHIGVSGPAVLDMSRHYLDAERQDPGARLHACWLPARSPGDIESALLSLRSATPVAWLARQLPERLARALCTAAGVPPGLPAQALPRDARRRLLETLTAMPLPITGSRGFAVAEATAGGVPLAEMRLETLESRQQPGLYLCGEICDVDGRIGGFNFQWAWSSGYVAGVGVSQQSSP